MQDWSGVLPTGLPQARIERLEGAIVRPPGNGDMKGLPQVCGVFRADGSAVDLARTVSIGGALSEPCKFPQGPYREREGAWLFGGLLFHHFGHAFIYSLSRLWAVRRLLDDGVALRGILFHQRYQPEPQPSPALTRNMEKILSVFAPGVAIATTGDVERVEELYVPQQGISTLPELFLGLPEQRQFFRDSAARIPPNAAPRDIYISRSQTGWKGNHLFETEIERALAAAGYLIFHPQKASLEEQIATYRSARRLIAVDGSALHIAATAVPSSAKVAVISRREFYAWAIADQIHAFANCDSRVIEAHADVYVFSRGLGRPASWFTTLVTTDFNRLGHDLVHHGFLDDAPIWQIPTETQLADRLASAKAKIGDDLVQVPDHIRSREPFFGSHRAGRPVQSGVSLDPD